MTQAALRLLRREGLAEMSPTGKWKATRKGDELVAALDLLEELCGGPHRKATPRGMIDGATRAGRRREEGS